MPASALSLTHLSFFAHDEDTGQPIAHLPVYAEIGLSPTPAARPVVTINPRLEEPLIAALHGVDRATYEDDGARARVVTATLKALSRVLTPESADKLLTTGADCDAVLHDLFKRALNLAHQNTLSTLDGQRLADVLEAAAREACARADLEVVEPSIPDLSITWKYPLGVLATDHVGYLSYDLTRLPREIGEAVTSAVGARRLDPAAPIGVTILLHPKTRPGPAVDALAQGRLGLDAIVVKHLMPMPDFPAVQHNQGLLAMQRPSLVDWRLSPGSFAANPGALIGQDGCESLLPANVALHQFEFHQVIGLTDFAPDPAPGVDLESSLKLGVAHEYRMVWFPLGHSLGQILYSFPLAPGESVNLAVIDWTRRDQARRDETTKLTEQIVHDQRRDRTITETVNAALDEWQRGGNVMAGIGVSAALGAGVGLSGALGGGYSTSSGSRDLAANTVQKLADHITQASAALRELQSTVVVQSAQTEKEAIETRTVVNYNHSHALTILYYEVLRHFRVLTEWVGAHPVILYQRTPANFANDDDIIRHRFLLERALLDERLRPCFDAVDKLICLRAGAKAQGKLGPRNWSFTAFTVELLTGKFPEGGSSLRFFLIPRNGNPIRLNRANVAAPDPSEHKGDPFTGPGGEYAKTLLLPEVGEVAFSSIKALRVNFVGHDKLLQDRGFPDPADWVLGALRLTGTHAKGQHVLFDSLVNRYLVCPPGEQPRSAAPVDVDLDFWSPDPMLFDDPSAIPTRLDLPEADRCCLERLSQHLVDHSAHYNRFLWLNEDPDARAILFAGIDVGGSHSLLELIENRALAVLGNSVVYPCTHPDWIAQINAAVTDDRRAREDLQAEQLLTLPTRGVFAEAKLGHCNASEIIDNTRFWDWQQSPVPHLAPEIAPLQAVTPQAQQPNLTPTAFPQSLVNIVNPPAAPDPTGMATALKAISTPNIFHDMSGRAEVAGLLKELAEGSIDIVEAANKAKEIQAKHGSNLEHAGNASTPAKNTLSSPAKEVHDANQVIRNSPEHTPAEKDKLVKENNQKLVKPTPAAPPPKKTRTVSLDLHMKYPGGPTLSGRFMFTIQDLDGRKSLVADHEPRVFSGIEHFVFLGFVGPRLRISIFGYDEVLPPETAIAHGVKFHRFDSTGFITLPKEGDLFVVEAVPELGPNVVVHAKTTHEAEVKATSEGKVSAKDIVEITQGHEVTVGAGEETEYEFTIKQYTGGLAFKLVA